MKALCMLQTYQYATCLHQGACDLSDVEHGVVQVTEIKKS
jgi:hypothetical protein